MRLTSAMLADAAQVHSGKLFVLGGGFDTITVRSLPAVHRSLTLAMVAEVEPDERQRDLELIIQLVDEDGSPLGIFWDIDNCPVPRGVDARMVPAAVKSALRDSVYKGKVHAFKARGNLATITELAQQELQKTGVDLISVPPVRKEAADKAIVIDMLFFAMECLENSLTRQQQRHEGPPPAANATICLISGAQPPPQLVGHNISPGIIVLIVSTLQPLHSDTRTILNSLVTTSHAGQVMATFPRRYTSSIRGGQSTSC